MHGSGRQALATMLLVASLIAPGGVRAADPAPVPAAAATSEFAFETPTGITGVAWASWTATVGVFAIDEARPTMDHLTSFDFIWWDIKLEGPDGTRLTPGTYLDARTDTHAVSGRAVFTPAVYAGICDDPHTDFTIRHLARDGTGMLTELDLSFELACPGVAAHAYGEVRYQYSQNPVSILTSSPDWLGLDGWQAPYGDVPVGSTGTPWTFTYTAAGRAGTVVGEPAITGANPGDFTIAGTTCTGKTLGQDQTCVVNVAFTPTAGGLREAELVVPSDADTGPRRIALNAIGKIPTTTTIELLNNPAFGQGSLQATITVTPNPGAGQAGVKYMQQGSWDYAYAPLDANGRAVVTRYGSGEVYGYFPGHGDYLSSTSAAVTQVTGLASHISLVSSLNPQEVTKSVTVTATLTADSGAGEPTSGTLRIVDETTGSVLASQDVASGLSAVFTGPLSIGDHALTATYDGQTTPFLLGPSTASLVQSVVVDQRVDATKLGLTYTTFYPVVDGYRDTVTARGTLGEAASSVAFTVVSVATGKTVRTTSLGARSIGGYSWAWNGRNAAGTIQAAGKYRVIQTITDVAGNHLSATSTVTLSKRKVVWHTETQTSNPTNTWAVGKDGGIVSTAKSRYAHGLYLASDGGWAGAVYRWSVPTGLAVKSVTFKVTGKSRTATKAWIAVWKPSLGSPGLTGSYDPWARAGTAYARYALKATGPAHVANGRVYGLVYTERDAGHDEAFDIGHVAVTVIYAEWR